MKLFAASFSVICVSLLCSAGAKAQPNLSAKSKPSLSCHKKPCLPAVDSSDSDASDFAYSVKTVSFFDYVPGESVAGSDSVLQLPRLGAKEFFLRTGLSPPHSRA